MAGIDENCCEMAELQQNPVVLWEDPFYKLEDCARRKKFSQKSYYDDICSKIRGIFILVINTHTSFPEFASSEEAIELTLRCLDDLNAVRQNNVGNDSYFPALLDGMKVVAIEVNTACFVTFAENKETPAKRRRTEKTVKAPRDEATVASISTSNKFQALASNCEIGNENEPVVREMETPVGSKRKVTRNSPESQMDTNEVPETTVPVRTAKKSAPRPPPSR